MGRRRQAREIALQALYVVDTAGLSADEAFRLVNRRVRGDSADDGTLAFARELIEGAAGRRDEIDERIAQAAQNWALGRMAAVDRSVLRLAAFELLFQPQTPVSVVIDEAIEIVRKYSTQDSSRFVNGILDKIKDHRQGGHGLQEEAR